MNPTTLGEAKELAAAVAKIDTAVSDCAVCAPFPFLGAVGEVRRRRLRGARARANLER